MNKDEALRLAKELEGVIADVENGDGFDDVCLDTVKYVRDCLAAIKQALEQPVASNDTSQDRVDETAKQRHEPVACNECKEWEKVCDQHLRHIKKLKAKREWQGLTDDERNDCLVEADPCECLATPEAEELMRCIEAKLKEKNT